MKCFTYGRRVQRSKEVDIESQTKVDVLKQRFQRMELLRKYFSVSKEKETRKFTYPVDESGNELNFKKEEIYDDLQYCEESDIEPMTARPAKKTKLVAQSLNKKVPSRQGRRARRPQL